MDNGYRYGCIYVSVNLLKDEIELRNVIIVIKMKKRKFP